jgi:hypothetical protein
MRGRVALVIVLLAGCQRTPEQQHADQLRSSAHEQAGTIENQAENQADEFQQQADALNNQANAAGGYTGKRLQVRADALSKEGKLVRKQANMRADAVKEAADARIKASASR